LSKAIEIAKVSAKGGFSLFFGVALSTVISTVGGVIVASLLTSGEYGLVGIAGIGPNLIIMLRDWGVNSAMIKYLAQSKSEGDEAKLKNVMASGFIFELIMGVLFSVVSFSLAGFLAVNVFHRGETNLKTLIEVSSIIVFAGSLLTASQSTFVGFERMEFSSLTMICQSVLHTILAPFLVLLGYEALGAVLGFAMAVLLAGVLGIAISYFVFYRKLGGGGLNFGGTLKTMLEYGRPLFVSAILGGFLLQFYSFMMAIYCSDLIIGNYRVAVNFSLLITFFTAPIATVLFPAFSKLDSKKEAETLRNVFNHSVRYTALFATPVVAAIMALSKPLVSTLFGDKYAFAPFFLTLYAIVYLYPGLGESSLGNLLMGQGETKVNMWLTAGTIIVGLPLSLVLIPRFGIVGLIVAMLVARVPSLVAGLWWVGKNFGATVNWMSTAKIYFSAGVAAIVAYLISYNVSSLDWIKLAVGGTIFIVIYLIAMPLTRAVDKSDINNLREMLSGLKALYPLFNVPLKIVEKILTITKSP